MKLLLSIFLSFLCTVSFAQKEGTDSLMVSNDVVVHDYDVDSLLKYAENYLGCKYGYGSCGPKTFDCSGFVHHVYGRFGIELPHSSGGIATVVDEVKLKKVQPGDLMFFAGRRVSKKNIGHVAIVHKVEGDKIYMIHATVQSGVISEVYQDSEYFTKRFIMAGRVEKKRLRD